MGTPAAAMTSLANALLPSSRAAAAPGPEGPDAGGAQRVAQPGHQRRLGPDHDQVHPERARQGHDPARVRPGRRGSPRRPRPMPALPPAQRIRGRSGDRPIARTRACSRPPPPTTSTVRLTPALSHTPRSAEPSRTAPGSMPRDGAVLPTAARRAPSARPIGRCSRRRSPGCPRRDDPERSASDVMRALDAYLEATGVGTALSPREPPVTDYARAPGARRAALGEVVRHRRRRASPPRSSP